jgi:hypothetical protein
VRSEGGNETSIQTTASQSLFQIHIQRINLTQEAILYTGSTTILPLDET